MRSRLQSRSSMKNKSSPVNLSSSIVLRKSTKLPQIAGAQEDDGNNLPPVSNTGGAVGICSLQGKRPYQEDEYAVRPHLCQATAAGTGETHFFGLFDGHAGGRCSKHIAATLPNILAEDNLFQTNLPQALKRSFHTANDHFLKIAEKMKIHDGSTGICAIIRDSKLLVANVGDCRALVISNRKAIQMSIDQKPTNPDEQKRIAALGGTVVYCMGVARVNRVLAVSRAFGNRTLRTVIRPDAEMMQRDLTKDDDYLVMASDGLWDVLKNKDVTEICYLNSLQGNTQLIADELAHTALNRGSMDNVTCLVIRISEFLENEDNYNTINRRVDSPSMRGRKNYASDTDGTYRSSDVSGIDSLSNSSFKLLGHMGVNRADSVVLSSNLEETENSMQPTRNSGGARIPFIKIPSNQTMQGSFDSPSGRLAKSNSTSILPHHLDNPGSSVASPMTKKLESIRLNEDLTQSTIDESEGESGKSLGIRHKTGNGVHTPTSANVAGPRRPSSLNDASLRAALTSGMPHILSMFGGSSKEEIGNGNGKKTAIVGWSETGNQ